MEQVMQKIARKVRNNIGTITTVASILFMLIGYKSGNLVFMAAGAYAFVKRTSDLSSVIRQSLDDDAKLKAAQADAIRKDAETKADLIAKAYQDGRVSDDDISLLVRSLAMQNQHRTQTKIVQSTIEPKQTVAKPEFRTVIDVKSTPVVEEKVEDTKNESTNQNSNSDDNIIHYTTEGGRFKFEYKGNAIAFSPTDIIKGSALHKEFEDSIGYYKNGEAVFYIYPVDKKIVAIPI